MENTIIVVESDIISYESLIVSYEKDLKAKETLKKTKEKELENLQAKCFEINTKISEQLNTIFGKLISFR